ncbi:GNAT family N-acetyltransferase [Dryocola clanedunensis]
MSDNILKSRTINLRLANEHDAAFIYSLRRNETLNKHISSIKGTVEDQEKWLLNYKEKESKGEEFYFIISRNDTNNAIGTVRVYGITEDKKFCWGSWILNDNKTVTAAIESALLVYKFAFEIKKLTSAYFQVDRKNLSVITFHLKTGAKFIFEDEVSNNYEFSQEAYKTLTRKYNKLIKG